MKKILMKKIRIIMDMVVDVVVDMAKAIEEEVVSIHQTMKEQTKTSIP